MSPWKRKYKSGVPPWQGKQLPAAMREKISNTWNKMKKTPEALALRKKQAAAARAWDLKWWANATEEQKRVRAEKISRGRMGWNPDEDTRKKMSKAKSGKNHPNWGKHLSEATKEKIRKARKGSSLHDGNRYRVCGDVI